MPKSAVVYCALLGLVGAISAPAEEKRNVLMNTYSRGFVRKTLTLDRSWIKYPAYRDRAGWERIPVETRKATISRGEKFLGHQWPAIKATDYLEFTRQGNRAVVDNTLKDLSEALRSLVMAELMEGAGRFTDDIINGVFHYCQMTYWGSSAHFYLYGHQGDLGKPTTVVPDQADPVIDLSVGDAAADLAWIWHFLHEEFDKVSPVIARRLKDEIKGKVLEPYYRRTDFWWLYGWDAQGRVNNWTPWCNYNVLVCILLLEDDPAKKEAGIYKSMGSVDVFINRYPPDGSCSEGPGYWSAAVGRMFGYLDLLSDCTGGKIDIFGQEKLREMGRYIYRTYVSSGTYYVNFSDASVRIRQEPGRIARIGRRIKDPVMESFGSFLFKTSNREEEVAVSRIGDELADLFDASGWQNTPPQEPLIAEYYFPNWDTAIARDAAGTNAGFYFSAKGGHNAEDHNHNDVGSFMLYYNGQPVFIDVGVGTYTRETFSKDRYSIWTMQSNFHNLPVINGQGQKEGGAFRATRSSFVPAGSTVTYSTDIAKAYLAETKVKSWVRSYTLERGRRFVIGDRYQLAENRGGTAIHFMTGLPCEVIRPGVVELKGTGFTLHLKYDPASLHAKVEAIKIDDRKLRSALGGDIARLVFDCVGDSKTGELQFEVVAVK